MGFHTTLDMFSGAIEQYESAGWSVREVEVTAGEAGDGTLHTTLVVPVTLATGSERTQGASLTPDAATMTEEGTLRVDFSPRELFELPDELDVTVEQTERSVRVADDDILLTIELTIEQTSEADPGAATREDADESSGADPAASRDQESAPAARDGTGTDRLAAVRDESVPPYEDTEYLRQLYESCSTFAEMSWQIDMDVSSETVRRYMIEAGIHDPNSYETASTGGQTDTSHDGTDAHESGSDDTPATDTTDDTRTTDTTDGTTTANTTDDTGETHTDAGGGHGSAETDTNSVNGEVPADGGDGAPTPNGDGAPADGTEAESHDQEPLDSQSVSVDPRVRLADEQSLTDGVELPADLELADVADAVVEATTVYEVQQRLGIELARTRELLKELNLLDLVLHRVSSPPSRTPSYEMVASRIDQRRAEKA